MGSLREEINYRLDREGVPDQLQKIELGRRRLAELTREGEELGQRIGLWDRMVFFSDTPDEAREGEVKAALRAEQAGQAKLQAVLEESLIKVGREYPPFDVGLRIERCLRVAREQLTVEGTLFRGVTEQDELQEALQLVLDRVLEVWVPDFDVEELFGALSGEEACRRAAANIRRQVEPHDRLGVAPLQNRDLVPLVAQRLLGEETEEESFFAVQKRLSEFEARRAKLEPRHSEAAAAVPLLDKVNVFSDSEPEQRRDSLAEELEAIRQELKTCYEQTRQRLHAALAAYPPLAVHQRLVETLGVVTLLTPDSEPGLSKDGAVVNREVVTGRALLFAALGRLVTAAEEAFPDVPLPAHLAKEARAQPESGPQAPALSPREELVAEFKGKLDASWIPNVRTQALGHAAMQGILVQSLRRVRQQISLFDRLVFFVDTAEEQQEDQLETRAHWHRAAAMCHWKDILELVRVQGAELAPFALRDQAVAASAALAAVHTDSGSSSSPKSCSVYGRGPVLETLGAIRQILQGEFGLEGSREAMLNAVAHHPPVEGEETPRGRFEPLPQEEVASRLARRLQGTEFRAIYLRLRETRREEHQANKEEEAVGEQISIWDTMNIFTTTPEEAKRKELRAELAHLAEEVRLDMEVVDELFQGALGEVYPPGRVYYSLGGVRSAVGSIRAVCRSRTVTTGTGSNRRTQTRYYCDLVGKGTAQTALRSWCRNLAETFGQLPGYHEVLEEWELDRLG